MCQIAGGLGNQLFMYSAGRALAWRNGANLIADTGGFRYDTTYRREWALEGFDGPAKVRRTGNGRVGWLARRGLLHVARRLPLPWRYAFVEEEPAHFQPGVRNARLPWIQLAGCWQSEQYFDDFRARLLEDLRFTSSLSQQTRALAAEIDAEPDPVAVHVRSYRDVPNPSHRQILPWSYSIEASARIRAVAPKVRLYVFADDSEFAHTAKDVLGPAELVLHNHARGSRGALEDLYLMSRCRHFVVANSSLSWWGAWLSQARWGVSDGKSAGNRVIFAPSSNVFNTDFVPSWWNTLAV